jgi:hypothetical protein
MPRDYALQVFFGVRHVTLFGLMNVTEAALAEGC